MSRSKTQSYATRRRALDKEVAKIVDRAFSGAFNKALEIAAEIIPDGGSLTFARQFARAMRARAESAERALPA